MRATHSRVSLIAAWFRMIRSRFFSIRSRVSRLDDSIKSRVFFSESVSSLRVLVLSRC